jgi:hypothetical protein
MTWTTHSAAPEWGIDRKTLRKRLADAGHDLQKKKRFTTREISEAIKGDEKLERIRGIRLDNELKEVEIAEKREQLMSTSDAMAVFNAWGLPIRQKIVGIDAEMKHRCNMIDPDMAGKALNEWKHQTLRLIQAEIRRISEERAEPNQQESNDES